MSDRQRSSPQPPSSSSDRDPAGFRPKRDIRGRDKQQQPPYDQLDHPRPSHGQRGLIQHPQQRSQSREFPPRPYSGEYARQQRPPSREYPLPAPMRLHEDDLLRHDRFKQVRRSPPPVDVRVNGNMPHDRRQSSEGPARHRLQAPPGPGASDPSRPYPVRQGGQKFQEARDGVPHGPRQPGYDNYRGRPPVTDGSGHAIERPRQGLPHQGRYESEDIYDKWPHSRETPLQRDRPVQAQATGQRRGPPLPPQAPPFNVRAPLHAQSPRDVMNSWERSLRDEGRQARGPPGPAHARRFDDDYERQSAAPGSGGRAAQRPFNTPQGHAPRQRDDQGPPPSQRDDRGRPPRQWDDSTVAPRRRDNQGPLPHQRDEQASWRSARQPDLVQDQRPHVQGNGQRPHQPTHGQRNKNQHKQDQQRTQGRQRRWSHSSRGSNDTVRSKSRSVQGQRQSQSPEAISRKPRPPPTAPKADIRPPSPPFARPTQASVKRSPSPTVKTPAKRQRVDQSESRPESRDQSAVGTPRSGFRKSTFADGAVYERIGQVGEGTYGKVYKAKHRATGEVVALKRIRMEQERDGFPITSMREIKLLQRLEHPGVVTLLEMMIEKGSVYVVFEYMEHDLTGLLANPQIDFSPANIKDLSQQFFSGLAYLHDQGVLHRDLKASNILLNNAGELKLADFGLARFYHKNMTRAADYTNRVITLWFRPPELLLGATAYGASVDIWSAGCIFVELFTKTAPFPGKDEIHQLELIYQHMGTATRASWPGVEALPWFELVKPGQFPEGKFKERFSGQLSPAALQLAEEILVLDPAKRPTASALLKHAYFTEELPHAERRVLSDTTESHEWDSKQRKREERKRTGSSKLVPPPQKHKSKTAVQHAAVVSSGSRGSGGQSAGTAPPSTSDWDPGEKESTGRASA
ncbi:kinase-like domain-containing protein [Protomyces lactucae-debilis]|uniref:Kinase-like domain-containing protein n=1 Tax=Protomyces lactucae-debilis TaxID=2754530 RepID=A0A1Y2F512_PROLT|nr:kinase-like domain-containing protein [Protomyces lactucae-debilis]ORY78943.1 kinase-like domain-containing protein [Protomyces lactucae-debilis]